VLCTGEPGIGKSGRLSVAADRLEAIGGHLLRGGASEAEAMPPYLPFLEALAPVIRAAPLEELAADAGPGALTLTTIFSENPTRLRTHPSVSPLPPEQSRLRLFQALGAFLAISHFIDQAAAGHRLGDPEHNGWRVSRSPASFSAIW